MIEEATPAVSGVVMSPEDRCDEHQSLTTLRYDELKVAEECTGCRPNRTATAGAVNSKGEEWPEPPTRGPA